MSFWDHTRDEISKWRVAPCTGVQDDEKLLNILGQEDRDQEMGPKATEGKSFCFRAWSGLSDKLVHVCYLDEGHEGECVCGHCDHHTHLSNEKGTIECYYGKCPHHEAMSGDPEPGPFCTVHECIFYEKEPDKPVYDSSFYSGPEFKKNAK